MGNIALSRNQQAAEEDEPPILDLNAALTAEIVQLEKAQTAQLPSEPNAIQPSIQANDFLAQLLDNPLNQQLPFMPKLKTDIARLEQRMGKKINQYLGFVGDLKGYGELYVKYRNK